MEKFYRIPKMDIQLLREGSLKADRQYVRKPNDAYEVLKGYFTGKTQEHFLILMLNTKNRIVGVSTVSVGTVDSALVAPRDVFVRALSSGCTSILIAHNHPSGESTPSQEDIALTHRLTEAGKLLQIPVLDHVVIGDDEYTSLKEQGII